MTSEDLKVCCSYGTATHQCSGPQRGVGQKSQTTESMEAMRCWKNIPVEYMSRWQYRKHYRSKAAAQTQMQSQAAEVICFPQVKSLELLRLSSGQGGHGQERPIDEAELDESVEAAAVVFEGGLHVHADMGCTTQTRPFGNVTNLGRKKHGQTKRREQTWRPRRSQTKQTQTDCLELSADAGIQATMFVLKRGSQTRGVEAQTNVTGGPLGAHAAASSDKVLQHLV